MSNHSVKPDFSKESLTKEPLLQDILHHFAHEAGNPLTSIISIASVIEGLSVSEQNLDGITEKINKFGSIIVSEAWRLSRLNEFLVLSLSNREASSNPIRIAELIKEISKKAKYRRNIGKLCINFAEPDEDFTVLGDSEQIRLLYFELLRNAYTYQDLIGAESPQAEVSLVEKEDFIELHVKNSLLDDFSEDLSELCTPFKKGSLLTKGSGLGLTMVYSIATRLGGYVDLEVITNGSNQKTFLAKVAFPLGSKKEVCAQDTPVDEKKPQNQSDTLKILIAEDEENICSAIKKILSFNTSDSHNLDFTLTNGENFHSLINDAPLFDLILLDVNLAGISGMDAFKYIEEKFPNLQNKVLFLSGSKGDPALARKLKETGRPCIFKPFEASELIEVVNSVSPSIGG